MRNKLLVHDGLITRGSRIVIPVVMVENVIFIVWKRRESSKEKKTKQKNKFKKSLEIWTK